MKTRTIRELWRIAKVTYSELIFRSLLIQNIGVTSDRESVEKVIKKAGTYSFLKIFLAFPIGVFAFEAAFITADKMPIGGLMGIMEGTLSISAFWILSVFILFLVSVLQASIVLSDKLYEPLMVLNLSVTELSIVVYLTLFRIFDIPIIATIIFSFVAFILLTRNVLLSLLVLSTTVIAIILTVTILTVTGSKLSKSIMKPEVKLSRSIAKILLLVGYTFSFSVIYVLPNMLIQYIEPLSKIILSLDPVFKEIVLSVPPISYAYVVLIASYEPWMLNNALVPLISTIFTTIGILFVAKRTLTTIPRSIFSSKLTKESETKHKEISLNPSSTYFGGLIRKEFKIIFRNPNAAIVFMFGPIMFILYSIMYIAIGLGSTFLSSTVTMIVPLLIFMAPNMLVAEGEGLAYLFTLPIRTEDILKVKSLVMTLSYVLYVTTSLPIIMMLFGKISTNYFWLIPSTSGFFLTVYYAVKKALNDMMKKNISFMELRSNIGYILYIGALLLIFFATPYFLLIISIKISTYITQIWMKKLIELTPYIIICIYTIWALNQIFRK